MSKNNKREDSVAFAYIDHQVYQQMLGFYKAFGIKPPPPPGKKFHEKLPK